MELEITMLSEISQSHNDKWNVGRVHESKKVIITNVEREKREVRGNKKG
jgi:hypothetical protein